MAALELGSRASCITRLGAIAYEKMCQKFVLSDIFYCLFTLLDTEDTMTLTMCAGYFFLAERQLLFFFSQYHTSVSSGTLFLSVSNK